MKLGDEVSSAETICDQLEKDKRETNKKLDEIIRLLTILVCRI